MCTVVLGRQTLNHPLWMPRPWLNSKHLHRKNQCITIGTMTQSQRRHLPIKTTTHSSVATDNVVQGESQLTLPAVTSADSARDTTPTVAATQASTLAPDTKELPPVESLSSEPSSVNTASASPLTQQPATTYRPPVTQAARPARSPSVTAIPAMNNAHLSDAQQIARLQQQMQNMVAMNMPQQIADLQQQVQTLTGQLAESQHAVQVLQQQQTDFYKDMDQRIAALKKHANRIIRNGCSPIRSYHRHCWR